MSAPELCNILYVEDNPRLRCVTKMALEVIGRFHVRDCGSGRAALLEAAGFNADLILVDAQSCLNDGLRALARLRLLPQLRDTPAMFITGLAAAADVTQYVAAGAIGIIAKPLEPLRLALQVRQLWASQDEWSEGGRLPAPRQPRNTVLRSLI
ncbi:response regulator [Pseudoduganella namucuonensis]|uniref:Response regulator receiver domain-containing protein n=1 Tax=Pseudoduganella namucuonensis TaxID=1035707 RepID=A0A1I7EUQ0_9BURK|nr:response regulator [Pseudoduganella namucuonensis]SFU27629.1 Response regulator receiver domain-containing protein [Pseudoduganella namucuonensis]